MTPKFAYKQIAAKKEFLPFFVYDYEAIRGQILKLKKYLPPNVRVYYSVKANPNIAILRVMKNFGFGAEIVSWGEFMAARKTGFNSAEILLGGAKKSDSDFLMAAKERIGLVSLESLSEIGRFNKIAGSKKLRPAVILRLSLENAGYRPGNDYKTTPRFGISPEEFKKIIPDFSTISPNLDLRGVHIYEANRILDSRVLTAKIDQLFSFIFRLRKNFNFEAQILNIGGGFGSAPDRELPVPDFGRGLSGLINKYQLHDSSIILELGRYLVNSSGCFVSSVIDLQKSGGNNFLIIRGLINHLLRIFDKSETESRFKESPGNYPVNILPERKNSPKEPFVICGQLSSLADTFGRRLDCRFLLPYPRKGDFIVIGHVGSYGLTQSLALFGSKPMAAEFLLINGKLELIRDKGRAEDFLLHQRIPEVLKLKTKNERQR